MTRSMLLRRARLALLPWLSIVSACAGPDRMSAAFPRALDVEASIAPKPVPTLDILTNAKADSAYNAAVETWGDMISAAAGRMCRHMVRMGAKWPFDCPPAPTAEPPQELTSRR